MARSLWLCNLVLALLTVALVWGMVQSFSVPPDAGEESRPVPRVARETAQTSEKEAPASQIGVSSPPLSDFDLIVTKETFKNPLALVQRPVVAPPPPPLPPLPALIGTMIVGEERKAVLVGTSKTEIYKVGQSVAGGKLVAIEADRVSIERGGTTEVIMLKAALQPVASAAPRAQPAADQPASAEGPPAAAAADPSMLLLRNSRGGSRGSGR
jgi:type II secretory pathway component PulC